MLRDDQAQQLGVHQPTLATADMGSRQTDPGQDPIIEEDVKSGQEAVMVIAHTKGVRPSAKDQERPRDCPTQTESLA